MATKRQLMRQIVFMAVCYRFIDLTVGDFLFYCVLAGETFLGTVRQISQLKKSLIFASVRCH
jgi:hypothetical protein